MQKRTVATATALILLCVGLLARWHASDAAHAHEQSGRVVHAHEVADHHELGTPEVDHLHGREAHGHAGDCTLLAMAHQPFVHAPSPCAAVASAPHAAPVETVPVARHATIAGYRLAPKTSPPSA